MVANARNADGVLMVTVLRWRADGWPICPLCDDDELYSLAHTPTPETVEGCYGCGNLVLRNPKP